MDPSPRHPRNEDELTIEDILDREEEDDDLDSFLREKLEGETERLDSA